MAKTVQPERKLMVPGKSAPEASSTGLMITPPPMPQIAPMIEAPKLMMKNRAYMKPPERMSERLPKRKQSFSIALHCHREVPTRLTRTPQQTQSLVRDKRPVPTAWNGSSSRARLSQNEIIQTRLSILHRNYSNNI